MGISGASGMIYAARLLRALDEGGHDVTVCVSDGAAGVMRYEGPAGGGPAGGAGAEGVAESGAAGPGFDRAQVIQAFFEAAGLDAGSFRLVAPEAMGDACASGSSLEDAAIICPCSMSTAASIAAGITRNLIHRVADVMMKESRPLVLVPRETPLSEIHLRNLLALRRAGVQVVPAMPAFYTGAQTIEELADFVAGKVLDVLHIRHELFDRWEGS